MTQMNASWSEVLKAKGFSGLSGLMAVFTFASTIAVMIVVVLFLSLGIFMLRGEGSNSFRGGDQSEANIHTTMHTTKFKLSPEPACVADIRKNGGNDVSKCPLVRTELKSDDIPAGKKDPISFTGGVYMMLPTLINVIPAVVLAYGLFQAGLCFLQLSQGRYFASRTITNLRNFAFAGLFYVLVSPCLPLIYTLLANLISFINLHVFTSYPAHSFTLPGPYTPPSFAIGSATNFSSFLMGIYAFTLAIIAALMTKASAIAEDNAQII